MNLYEMLEGNYSDLTGITREQMANHLKTSVASGYNRPDIRAEGINTIQAAVLLSYAGNMDHVLSDNEYTQFSTAIKKAMDAWNSRIRPDATTAKIATPIVKHGQLI